jgi:hypothetical protein
MARVAITPTVLFVGGSTVDPAGTATVAGAGNGVQVAQATAEKLIFRLNNATGGSGTVSILAGSQPSAQSAGQGPLVVTVAAGSTQWAGPFESARFVQPDGSIIVESSVVVTVAAFQVNRH